MALAAYGSTSFVHGFKYRNIPLYGHNIYSTKSVLQVLFAKRLMPFVIHRHDGAVIRASASQSVD